MGWYEALKDAFSVADRLRDAELKLKLAAVQVECANLATENANLRGELMAFREQAHQRDEMAYRSDVYWRRNTAPPEGPYCPRCLDGTNRVARMTMDGDDHCWRCHTCGHAVIKPSQYRSQAVVGEEGWEAG
jgi:hypothetical protein